MRYSILGPLRVQEDGQELSIPGQKERAILGLLIVEAGTVVSTDRIIHELWKGQPPNTAIPTLRSHLSRLRKALRSSTAIVTSRPGYTLDADPTDIDAAEFEAFVDRSTRSGDDPETRLIAANSAVELWRGPALTDLDGYVFAETEARRLEERRLIALEAKYDCELELENHQRIVPELNSLIGRHPYYERFRAQLMLALYRCGRTGDALGAYAATESDLGEALGIGPSPELRALERAIVLEDPSLELGTFRQLHNLPASVSSFVGREKELNGLTIAFDRSRIITLVGAGGSGKSRLALEAAARSIGKYSDGAFRVELAPVRDPDSVPTAISSVFGEPASHSENPIESLKLYLHDREMLLVLDNCEHLLDSCAGLVEQIASSAPGISVLATSRQPLRISGETVWLVPPLQLPDPDGALDDQVHAEAFRLFVERAKDAYPDFEVTERNCGTISQLCNALSGLPLALELAASRSASLNPSQLLARLGEGIDVLRGNRSQVPHHETMRSALDWSEQLLEPNMAELFHKLAVFVGGFTLGDAAAVLGELASPDQISALVDRSLVDVVGGSPPRYRLLEPIREFAGERLAKLEDAESVRESHARHFLSLARAADNGLRGSDQQLWLSRMSMDHDNVRSAIRYSLENKAADRALALVAAMGWFWFEAGHWRESWDWLEETLTTAGENHSLLRAQAVYKTGALQIIRANPPNIIDLVEWALQECREKEDRYGEAWCVHLLGHSALNGPNPSEALTLLEEAREIFVELECSWELAWSDRYIGDALALTGRADEGIELQLRSISAFREMGDLSSTAFGLYNLAGLLVDLEGHGGSAARPYFERSLRVSEETGNKVWAAHALNGLARCAFMAGSEHTERMFLDAKDQLRLIGDDTCLSTAIGWLGEVHRNSGKVAGAAECYAEALRIKNRLDSTYGIAVNLTRLALLALQIGHHKPAAQLGRSVQRALNSGELFFPSIFQQLQDEVARTVDVSGGTEELRDVIPVALEFAEMIRAEPALDLPNPRK